jgi:DNA (cytosine-5)-methyltransferase 1
MKQLSMSHEVGAKLRMGGKSFTYVTAFRRVRNGKSMAELRFDGIAGCLRTPRGGSGRQILLKAGKGRYQVRLLTPRECARLQGVPESYVINVPLNQALFGFGDAVCVPAIEWIAKHYLSPVAREMIKAKAATPLFGSFV